jgi:hypothetical protein
MIGNDKKIKGAHEPGAHVSQRADDIAPGGAVDLFRSQKVPCCGLQV